MARESKDALKAAQAELMDLRSGKRLPNVFIDKLEPGAIGKLVSCYMMVCRTLDWFRRAAATPGATPRV